MSQLGYHEQIKARVDHLRKVMDEIMASEPASDHGPAHEAWLTEMADALCRLGESRSRLGMEVGDWDPPGIDGAFARGILLAARGAQSTSHLTHPFGVLRLAAKADPLLVNVRRHIADWINGHIADWAKRELANLPDPDPGNHSNDGDVKWSKADSPARWAKVFGVSWSTLKRRFEKQTIRNKKLTTKSYQVAIADIPSKPT
jgi:hypothetical protein